MSVPMFFVIRIFLAIIGLFVLTNVGLTQSTGDIQMMTHVQTGQNVPTQNDTTIGRGDRYGEILLIRRKGMKFKADVWGTQGLNDCPSASWKALDENRIKAETGAFAVFLNGPRYWLPNVTWGSLPSSEIKTFGDLQMRQLATLKINPRRGKGPYKERAVKRQTTFVFNKGEQIYELISPNGAVYVMQSMSQAVDPILSFAQLPHLASRLSLPKGWVYRARTLNADLVLQVQNEAVVLQDDLLNTYQRR